MLVAVLAAFAAFWTLLALITGLVLGWPTILLGCLAGVVVVGTVTSAVIFRVIHRQGRY